MFCFLYTSLCREQEWLDFVSHFKGSDSCCYGSIIILTTLVLCDYCVKLSQLKMSDGTLPKALSCVANKCVDQFVQNCYGSRSCILSA